MTIHISAPPRRGIIAARAETSPQALFEELRRTVEAFSAALSARRRLDMALAKGERMPRYERRHLFQEAGMCDAAGPGTRAAAVSPELAADIRSFIASLSS